MRFRPANISLINRRLYLPRLRLTLSSIEKDDPRSLTGHYISMSVLTTIHSERSVSFRCNLSGAQQNHVDRRNSSMILMQELG